MKKMTSKGLLRILREYAWLWAIRNSWSPYTKVTVKNADWDTFQFYMTSENNEVWCLINSGHPGYFFDKCIQGSDLGEETPNYLGLVAYSTLLASGGGSIKYVALLTQLEDGSVTSVVIYRAPSKKQDLHRFICDIHSDYIRQK